MKKTLSTLSLLCILAYAPNIATIAYAQSSDKLNTRITNTDLSVHDNTAAQRNPIGECDATCHVTPPPPVPTIPSSPFETEMGLNEQIETITCEQAGYPSDWIGSVTRKRDYLTHNGVIDPNSYTPWVVLTDTCRAPNPCSSQNVSWVAGGQTCSGVIGNVAHNSLGNVTNTATKRTGSAVYSCFDGTLSYQSGSCTYVPDNCPARAVSWSASGNSCAGNLPAVNHGASRVVNTTTANQTGSATYTCNDGVISVSGQTCLRNCLAQAVSWTSNANTCSGTTGTVVHNATTSANNTRTDAWSNFSGSANYRCNNGTLVPLSNSCTRSCAGNTIYIPGGYERHGQFGACMRSDGSKPANVPYYVRTFAATVPVQCPAGTAHAGWRIDPGGTSSSGSCPSNPGIGDTYYSRICTCNYGTTVGGPIFKGFYSTYHHVTNDGFNGYINITVTWP